MKLKWRVFGLVIILFSLTSCSGKHVRFNNKQDIKPEDGNISLYISANGELIYGEAKIKSDSFGFVDDVVSMGIRKKRDIISEIKADEENQVYCSISTSNGKDIGNKVYVVKKDKIEKIIKLEKEFGCSVLINNQDEMYIQGAVRSEKINPHGVPFAVVDSNSEKQKSKFFVKGIVVASATLGDATYMLVTDPEKIGYKGFNDCYLAKYSSDTQKLEILNDDAGASCARSMAISQDEHIYVVDTPMYSDKKKVSYLYKYDLEGNKVSKYDLNTWADKIVINNENIAYISHRGKTEIYDDAGSTITVFDLKEEKAVDTIEVDEGPSDLFIFDDTLFVSAYKASVIDAINMQSNEVVGSIAIDNKYKIDQIIVTDNE